MFAYEKLVSLVLLNKLKKIKSKTYYFRSYLRILTLPCIEEYVQNWKGIKNLILLFEQTGFLNW